MGEIQIGPGDSVSRLLQTHAKEIGMKRVWDGNGRIDTRNVIIELHNMRALKDEIWKGVQELYAMPELKDLPESVQAKMMSIILNARSCAELSIKTFDQPESKAP